MKSDIPKTLVVLLTGIVFCDIPEVFTHKFTEGSLGVTNVQGNSPNNIIVVYKEADQKTDAVVSVSFLLFFLTKCCFYS